jgi:hypothetical protein
MPQYMASQPVNVKVKLDTSDLSRHPGVLADDNISDDGYNCSATIENGTAAQINAAIRDGGTVCLKGEAVLTPADKILVLNPVKLIGIDRAKIKGGAGPLVVKTAGPVLIEGLNFEGWFAAAITVAKSNDLTIKNNKIWKPGLQPSGKMMGILVAGLNTVTGNLNIEGNLIDIANPKVQSYGIFAYGANAEIVIEKNIVQNNTYRSVLLLDNSGRVDVKRNTLKPGDIGIGDTPGLGLGISALNGYLFNPNSNAEYHIEDNDITVGYKTARAIVFTGLKPIGKQSTIINNKLEAKNSPSGLIYLAHSDTLVANNSLRGQVDIGILSNYIATVAPYYVRNNSIIGNHMDVLQPALAHVYLGDYVVDTQVVNVAGGQSETVVDNGINSTIVDMKRIELKEVIPPLEEFSAEDLQDFLDDLQV